MKKTYVYHTMPLEQVSRGELVPDSKYSDLDFLPAYRWLEKEVGYFPLFLAVGNEDAAYVTGYQNQWRVHIGGDFDEERQFHKKYRKAGEFPNFVLFALPLSSVPVHDFQDYQWWNIVLTECSCEREVGKGLRRHLFKKSWDESAWLRHARRDGHNVQVVAPRIDLDQAEFIWVRNKATQKALEAQGFKNVRVKRLLLEE